LEFAAVYRNLTTCRRLVLPALFVCLLAAGASHIWAGDLDSSILVYPEKWVVSQPYPAQFVAIERFADGSSLDRTADAIVTFDESAGLKVENGCIFFNGSGPSKATIARVQVGDRISTVTVEVGADSKVDTKPILSFSREVMAVLGKSGCNLGTCHGNLHGKGGFRLSLRGDDPELDFQSIVRGNAGRRIDAFEADRSLLLQKPTGLVAHQGGVRFSIGSPEYQILKTWIESGATWNSHSSLPTPEPQPTEMLTQLSVFPQQSMLGPASKRQQLVVIACFADGSRKDVTRWARFEPSLPTGISVDGMGLVVAEKALDASISVSYLSGRTAARVTFLDESQPKWDESPAPMAIDRLVENQLQRMRLQPATMAEDNVLLRRMYLVTVGRLPTAEEATGYLATQESDKRSRLIESLLNDAGYASLWAMRWSDLLRNEQKVMSPKGAESWHRWMTDQIRNDRPVNEFVAEMVRSIGSTYDNPPASFHRTHRDPETAAESIGQVFLGVRLQCARCHNHPFDKWRQDDYYGLAAYFTTLERKQVGNDPKDKFDKHIISGDEVVSLSKKKAKIWHPGRAADVVPKNLSVSYQRESVERVDQAENDEAGPLEQLADWLGNNNRMLARNMANRVWYHFMGRGIVDPPDDFRDSNPPSNPELLEFLTDELIRSGYSIRHLSRLVLQSRTFARAGIDDLQLTGLDSSAMFAGYSVRRMPAEVLLDALSDVTKVAKRLDDDPAAETFQQRAVARSEVPTNANFLSTFGKPGRLLVCECERSNSVSLGQSLVLVNGSDMREKLAESKNRLSHLLNETQDLRHVVEQLYLTTLTRSPTAIEAEHMLDFLNKAENKRVALEDITWALINSQEFSVIR
jgi:Protein of unknown function (DUF1553)/Protein of unknown function (DUF1549)